MTTPDRLAAAVAHGYDDGPRLVHAYPQDDGTAPTQAGQAGREFGARMFEENRKLRAEVERLRATEGVCHHQNAAYLRMQGQRDAALARVEAAEGVIEKVRAFADRTDSAGRVYGYAVAHDLRDLLDGDSEGRESAQPVAQEGEEEWGVGHGTHFEQAADRRDAEEWIEDDDSWNPGERRWLVRRTVTPWVPVETGGEER